MKENSDSNKSEEFEVLNDEDYDLNLNNFKSATIFNNIITKKDDKIYEDDCDEINENKNKNFIINNELQEDKDIITETNVSETFKKIVENKEEKDKTEETFDFEKIELKEEEKDDFTEISISSLTSKKLKSKEEEIIDQKTLLYNIYQELNLGGGNNNINKNNVSIKIC